MQQRSTREPTADLDGGVEVEEVGLAEEDVLGLEAELADLRLRQLDLAAAPPALQQPVYHVVQHRPFHGPHRTLRRQHLPPLRRIVGGGGGGDDGDDPIFYFPFIYLKKNDSEARRCEIGVSLAPTPLRYAHNLRARPTSTSAGNRSTSVGSSISRASNLGLRWW
ncbi:hypothetical protein GW17_00021000 [Ensete ventricosum]|nr:hypothetical protein GW17_00021000 [Ensete ventricosum]